MELRSKNIKKMRAFASPNKYLMVNRLITCTLAARTHGVSVRRVRLSSRGERKNILVWRVDHGRRPMRWSRLPFAVKLARFEVMRNLMTVFSCGEIPGKVSSAIGRASGPRNWRHAYSGKRPDWSICVWRGHPGTISSMPLGLVRWDIMFGIWKTPPPGPTMR